MPETTSLLSRVAVPILAVFLSWRSSVLREPLCATIAHISLGAGASLVTVAVVATTVVLEFAVAASAVRVDFEARGAQLVVVEDRGLAGDARRRLRRVLLVDERKQLALLLQHGDHLGGGDEGGCQMGGVAAQSRGSGSGAGAGSERGG